MRKQISPMFAAIVIVVALAVAALYFMSRYRAHEAREAALSAAAQAQADAARASGRMGGAGMRAMRRRSAPTPAVRATEGGASGEHSLPHPESAAEEAGN